MKGYIVRSHIGDGGISLSLTSWYEKGVIYIFYFFYLIDQGDPMCVVVCSHSMARYLG